MLPGAICAGEAGTRLLRAFFTRASGEMAKMHDLDDCWCPLSSLHCKRQAELRQHWFNEVKAGNVGMVREICQDEDSAKDFLFVKSDDAGYNALHVAVANSNVEMAGVLIEIMREFLPGGHFMDAKSRDGLTALMLACQNGLGDLVTALVTHGASLSVRNEQGKTAAMLADAAGHPQMAELLEARFGATASSEADAVAEHPPSGGSPGGSGGRSPASGAAARSVAVDLWAGSDGSSDEDEDEDEDEDGEDGDGAGGTRGAPDAARLAARAALIAAHPLFADAARAGLPAQLAARCRERAADTGEALQGAGAPRREMLWVMAGRVKVEEGEGAECEGPELGPGEALGGLALLTGTPARTVALTALAPQTRVLVLPRRALSAALRADSRLLALLARAGALAAQPSGARATPGPAAVTALAQRIAAAHGAPPPRSARDPLVSMHERRVAEVPALANARDPHSLALALALPSLAERCHTLPAGRPAPEAGAAALDSARCGAYAYAAACADAGLHPLPAVLLGLRSTALALHGQRITDRMARAIAAGLAHNAGLEELDVGGNSIRDSGFVQPPEAPVPGLLDAALRHGGLRALGIAQNRLTHAVGARLHALVVAGNRLERLDVRDNTLGDPGVAAPCARPAPRPPPLLCVPLL